MAAFVKQCGLLEQLVGKETLGVKKPQATRTVASQLSKGHAMLGERLESVLKCYSTDGTKPHTCENNMPSRASLSFLESLSSD